VTSEPDMENLLASIRKAINSDIGDNSRQSTHAPETPPPFKGSMRELRVKFEDSLGKAKASQEDIVEIRNRINRNRTADMIVEPLQRYSSLSAPPPTRTGFAAILAGDMAARSTASTPRHQPVAAPPGLRPTLDEPERQVENYDVSQQTDYAGSEGYQDEQSYLPVVHDGYGDYPAQSLMSDQPALAANESFNQLADTLMARALGERSIEDMTHDLLRGMLKNWLDDHLPTLVERLVREEIERVARRGR
jgi:uncharacterized protein